MDNMAVSTRPEFPKGDELQTIIARANQLRARESGRILRRWLGLDRHPRPAPETPTPSTENPLPRQG